MLLSPLRKNRVLNLFHFFVFLLLLFPFSSLQAEEWMHGISMHGEPALSSDFQFFPYARVDAPKGGVLKQAVVGSFDNLNPNIVKGKAAQGTGYLFGRLMARSWDEPFTLYPWIAKSVQMDEQRRWIRFKIDDRARFSDGHLLTAHDVLFSFKILKEKGRPNFRNVYGLVDQANLIDDYTIEFIMSDRANRETPMIMGLMPIYAEHYWENREFDQTILEGFVSSGPYKVEQVDPGRQVVYQRMKDYWAQDIPSLAGQYNFDQLVYDYYRDGNVMQEAFRSGAFDLMREVDPYKWKKDYDFDAVAQGGIIKHSAKHKRPEEVKSLIFNTRKNVFSEKDIRLALRSVFDFDWVNKTLFDNSYNQISSIFPNSELAAKEKSLTVNKKYSVRQSLRQADGLLKKHGYIVKDGMRVNSVTGDVFSFEILLQDPSQEKIVLSYIQSLKKLGIEASVRTVDSAQFFARLNDFDFDMVLFKWHSSLSPGNEQSFYWGSKFSDIKGSRNYPGIEDREIDLIIEKLTQAVTREDLVSYARQLDEKIMDGVYFIPLYYDGYDRLAYNSRLDFTDYETLYGPIIESWWEKVN